MSAGVSRRLAELGWKLPEVNPPKGVYTPAVANGCHVYVSGQIPMVGGQLAAVGRVGGEVSADQAQELSRHCALAALAAAETVVGLDHVVRVVKVVGYVSSAEGFTGQLGVVNGASELFVALFGEAGQHACSAVGVRDLPFGVPVEIEVLLEVAV
ncbi:RidA family protein [Streptomyces olivaceiscleroticus]